VAALIAAYCGMVHFEEEEQKTTIEKFVDACKQDIHEVFLGFCSQVSDTEAASIYIKNGISCEIQRLRDTNGNFYVFSVVSTGEQIDVVSDPVSAAMCAIKYGMVEGHGTVNGVRSQKTQIGVLDVLRNISDTADKVIAKCLKISITRYKSGLASYSFSEQASYGDLNVMFSVHNYETDFRLSRTIEGKPPVRELSAKNNEVFAQALVSYGIYDLACLEDETESLPESANPCSLPSLDKYTIAAQKSEEKQKTIKNLGDNLVVSEDRGGLPIIENKPIKPKTLKEKIDAHNDELANQIILQYHEGLINSMQMAEQFQVLLKNMLDTFASYNRD
jgi:hypothetical protein